MATPFLDVYCLNEILKNDGRLKKKPINQVYFLYYKYLQHSISYFGYDCYKDLELFTPFSQKEYYYTSDGLDKEYFVSTVLTDGEFYVGYRADDESDYIQTFDFSFDSANNKIIINNNPPNGYEVYISSYVIGSFNSDLDIFEKGILSQGMLVPWHQEQENKHSLLNQIVYGGTTKIYSQANHIDAISNVLNNQYYKLVKGLISEYSYKNKNANQVKGLAGGGVVI